MTLTLIERIVALVSQILGLILGLTPLIQKSAQEHQPYAIETIASNGTNTVNNPTYGNSAIRTDIVTIAAGYTLADILAAIAAITPTPAAPPPSAEDNALAVWSALDPNSPGAASPYGDEQYEPYARALAMNQGGAVLVAASMHFTGWGYFGSVHAPAELNDPPLPDWSAILATDTRLSWLTRTEPRFTWAEDPTTHIITGYRTAGTGTVTFTFDMSEAEFDTLVGVVGKAAPVWPGLASVTLGTPVALSENLTVAGPLDGLLISVTTPPSGLGRFVVGGHTWWFRAGHVAFVSDNGDVEAWQYLTWDQALYVPKTMAHAASALVRVLAGAGGLATPWTLA